MNLSWLILHRMINCARKDCCYTGNILFFGIIGFVARTVPCFFRRFKLQKDSKRPNIVFLFPDQFRADFAGNPRSDRRGDQTGNGEQGLPRGLPGSEVDPRVRFGSDPQETQAGRRARDWHDR